MQSESDQVPVCTTESRRLATLARLQILGTPAEPALDRLVHTARAVFGVPICIVSLVGKDEEWYKARCGISATHGPRTSAFCNHAVMGDDVLVVRDASKDERFKHYPQVTAPDGVRFYAGAPIIAEDGSRIGSFCVKDREPRTWTDQQSEILRNFAAMAMSEIMHRIAIAASNAASRARTCFLSGINHAVRTPLTAIFGFSELLAETGMSPADRTDAVAAIRRNGEALIEFIDDAVMLADLETGGVRARPRDFVLSDLLRDLDASITSAALERNLSLHVWAHPDVPAILHNDPVLLRHALAHLLRNAVRSTTAGAVTLRVLATHDPRTIAFEVSDTGRGMSADQLGGIWNALDIDDDQSPRTLGFGMPIIARTSVLLGGTIDCRSTPGSGSTFTLRVRATAEHDELAPTRRAA